MTMPSSLPPASAFLKRFAEDPAFRSRFEALAGDPEALNVLLATEGYDCSPGEILETAGAVQAEANGDETLSAKELEGVTGGRSAFMPHPRREPSEPLFSVNIDFGAVFKTITNLFS